MSIERLIVKIDDIENSNGKTLNIDFENYLEGIESKEPFYAELVAISMGDFIKLSGHIQGVVTLKCDLCLSDFDYEIDIDIDEMFAKKALIDEYGAEIELKDGQFVTDLNGAKEMDISDILYQSVILDFPNKKVCGINCKGGDIFIRDENEPKEEIDPRLSIFKDIKIKKNS